jgi:hypothetical protein
MRGLNAAVEWLRRYGSKHILWCVLACVLGSAYIAKELNKGWIGYDDGGLAHTAERVLMGQVPHRDFDEPYTGGLTYVNGLAFRVLGTNLSTLRFVLFAVAVPWIATLFYVASRFTSSIPAFGLTLLAISWSIPNYTAALPSWYCLFLATFGCAAVFHYLDNCHPRWLFLAGLCGGLSVLVKIAGIYYLLALGLFALYWEQSLPLPNCMKRLGRISAYSLMLGTACGGLTFGLCNLICRRPGLPEIVHFVVPAMALQAVLFHGEWTRRVLPSRERFQRLLHFMLPVLSGAALPMALFIGFYVYKRSTWQLYRGILVLPTIRLALAAHSLPALETFAIAIPPAIFVAFLVFGKTCPSPFVVALIWVVAGVLLYAGGRHEFVFNAMLMSARNILPLVIAISVPRLIKDRSLREQQLMFLCCVSAFCALIQFPYSNAVYFCYVAPLVVLVLGRLGSLSEQPKWRVSSAILLLYGFFAVICLTPRLQAVNTHLATSKPTRINILRAGSIQVDSTQARDYEGLIAALKQHCLNGAIYVTPSSPEVYFLAGMRNPTRTIFDIFDSSDQRVAHISKQLMTARVNVVVINEAGEYPGPSRALLEARLRSDFPYSEKIGYFDVRWRQ